MHHLNFEALRFKVYVLMIDSHAHMDDEAFRSDLDAIIEKAQNGGIKAIVSVSETLESSRRNLELSARFSILKPAVGCHPHNADSFQESDQIELLAHDPSVVCIGETGLDFAKNLSSKERQKNIFEFHIELAVRTRKPVSIHCRNAHAECYEMLKNSSVSGIMHCYSGSPEAVERFVDIGLYISFAGPVTFTNADTSRNALKQVPLDRLLIETDSPVLSPHPFRGERNEPTRLGLIVEKIAQVRHMDLQQVIDITTQNARRVFKL
jgi:TatD DNase family protein